MRIKDEIRQQIIEDYATKKYSYATLGAKYGVAPTSVARIVNPEYHKREREKNKIRKRSYTRPKPKHSINICFYEQDEPLINKVKSVDNIHTYVKGLIQEDINKK